MTTVAYLFTSYFFAHTLAFGAVPVKLEAAAMTYTCPSSDICGGLTLDTRPPRQQRRWRTARNLQARGGGSSRRPGPIMNNDRVWRNVGRQTDRQTDRYIDRKQADRQTNRQQTDRETDRHIQVLVFTFSASSYVMISCHAGHLANKFVFLAVFIHS